ncbi:MAG: DUF5689 domain-containing protein [Alistipes sp.]|jgi:hypothetical protein|nr:DUF5689 domain-containing protein [Alistipes sp.]
MKRNFLTGLLAVAAGAMALGTTGCTDPEKPKMSEIKVLVDGKVDATPSFADISADGDEFTIQVESSKEAWEVTSDTPEWITISPESGSAGKTTSVDITVAANNDEGRNHDIVFETADGKKETVEITQLGLGEVSESFGEGKISIRGLNKLWAAGGTIPANTFIEGTVISDVAGANLDTRGFCIWDATSKNSGIQIYQLQGLSGEPQAHTFALNSTVKVQLDGAEMTEYNGLRELTKIDVSDVTPSEVAALTTPANVANYAALTPEYQNMLVSMPNVTATNNTGTPWGAGSADKTTAFKDADEAPFNVFIRKYSYQGFQETAIPEATGTITGLVGYHTTHGTQIQPRNVADVEALGQGTITPVFGVNGQSVSVNATAGDASVNVTGNVDWTAAIATNGGGVTIKSGAAGNGAGTVTLTFPENLDTSNSKVTTVTIATTADVATKSYTVTFTQKPAGSPDAKTATFDIPNMGLVSANSWGSQTVNGITIAGDGGGNSNDPKFYSTGTPALRTYKDNTLTFTGGTITKIEWTNGSKSDGVTCASGSISGTTWTGSAASVVLTTASTTVDNPQHHYTKIIVTYE